MSGTPRVLIVCESMFCNTCASRMMHDALGPDLGWIFLGLTVWLAVIGGAVAATVRAIRKPSRHPATRYPSPLDILERRLVSGEITREEFDEARARLREHELDL